MPKINPADAETSRILELQRASADRTRIPETLTLAAVSSLLLVFGMLIWALPRADYSADENRALAPFPDFSLSALAEGKFTSGIADFYSDHFALRRYFVEAKAIFELAQLKFQNNDTLPASGAKLAKRLEYDSYTNAEKNLAAIGEFSDVLGKLGIPLTVAFPPRSIDVFASDLHPLYGSDRSGAVWSVIESSGIESVDLLAPLAARSAEGDYVWYRTDHHWTTLGAYVAYAELAPALGYEAYPPGFFTPERVSDNFYGTTWSASGMRWTPPDSIDYLRFPGDGEYIVENVLTGRTTSGFYQRDYLEEKDKYSSFLGVNSAHLRVRGPNSEALPTLLIIKDSYAHSLAPFLALHFNLEIVDLRFYTGSTAALALSAGADAALILVGADSLASSSDLALLRYGLASLVPSGSE